METNCRVPHKKQKTIKQERKNIKEGKREEKNSQLAESNKTVM